MSSIRDMEEQIEDLQRQIQETRMVLESTPVDGRSGHRRARDSGISSLLRSVIEEAEEEDTVSVQSSSRQRDRYADKRAKVEDEKERTSGERFDGRTGNDANRFNNKTQRQNKSVLFKPTRYDGTTSWVDYLSHFEMCSIVNEWTEDEKGLYLAVSLSGLAQSVLGDLPSEQRKNFKVLVNALEDRFLPPSQTELYRVQMRERKQRASESLPELGQAIRRLTNLAYPTAPNDVRETLAKEQFLDALAQSDVRLRVKQARPDTLNDAIRLAVELEAYNRAESRTHGSKGYARLANEEASSDVGESKTHESGVSAWMTKMEHMMKSLASELKDMKKVKEQFNENKGKACYNCGKQGHFAKDCRVKCKNCGKSGHSTSDCRCPKKCFKCGKEGHIAPQCKENMKDESDKNGKVQGAKGRRRRQSSNISALKEAGMFVEIKISGVKARFLIDTGATLTIVSARLYDKLPISSKPSIVESEQDVHSVCGNSLDLKGKAVFELLLGEEIYETEAVVTKLEVDGILGLDFLLGNDCDLRIRRGVLETPSGSVPIQFKGSLGCYRVVAVDTISIPPSSEIVVLGRVCVSEGETIPDMEAVVESNEKSVNRDTALTARTLVRAKEIVPIRLMNVHSEAKVVHSGTTLGELSRAVPVVASVVEDSSRRKEEKELRADIQKLFDEASNNLDENQQNLLRDLLLDYTDSFAATSSEAQGLFSRLLIHHPWDTTPEILRF